MCFRHPVGVRLMALVLALVVVVAACSDERTGLDGGSGLGHGMDGGTTDAGAGAADSGAADVGTPDAGLDPPCGSDFGAPVPLTTAQVGQRVVIAGTVFFPTNAVVVAPRECEPLMEGLRPASLRPEDVMPRGESVRLAEPPDAQSIPCGCPFGEDPRCDTVPLLEGTPVWVRGQVSRREGGPSCTQIPCYRIDIETICRTQ